MANTISQAVKEIIDRTPFVTEMMIQDVISFSNLAKNIQPKIEQRMGKTVNPSAIVMALRRYSDELKKQNAESKKENKIGYELMMKTKIHDVNLARNDEFIRRLSDIYDKVHLEKGDFLNITIGSHEMSLAVSEKYNDILQEMIKGEHILNEWSDLVAITIVFEGDFLKTPGLLYLAARKLAWEQINVIEVVSTMNVLTFVVERDQSIKAYDALQSFLDEPGV